MKRHKLRNWIVGLGLWNLCAHGAIPVVVEPLISGLESDKATVVSDYWQVELSNRTDIQVVERARLKQILEELKLTEQALGDPAESHRLGSLLGAKYFIRAWMGKDGDEAYFMIRLIQVDTTLVRTHRVPVLAGASAMAMAQALVGETAVALGIMDSAVQPAVADPVMEDIPDDWVRPVVMVMIPDTHVAPVPLVDPAAETELISQLIRARFTVVDSEYAKLARESENRPGNLFGDVKTSARHAASRGAEVLLYGEALSERAASLGDFVGCRARVEVRAVNTRTEQILVIDRAEGTATDVSEAVAAKRAIESAAQKLGIRFLPELAKRWNEGL